MDPVRVGALVPLTRPGWVEAGRQLLAGMELAAGDVGLELVVRDTAADPDRAAAAIDELAGLGVGALAGEYHSVVARTAAARAEALGLPYLCSSAVLDALADEPAEWVARLSPPQSRGWRIYADFLLGAGHRRVAVATEPSVYWATGTRILREHLAPRGGTVVELDARRFAPAAVADAGATALLLLAGHPDPSLAIVAAIRRDPCLAGMLIGAPAGQPELAGEYGAGVPFLRYRPERLTPLGARVETALRKPSFVAFEGYDTILALAERLRTGGPWSRVALDGTRGPIRFSRVPGIGVWQWAWPPVQVVERDPADPARFRILHSG